MTELHPAPAPQIPAYQAKLMRAKRFMKAAEVECSFFEYIEDATPALSQMMVATNAFCDALSLKYTGHSLEKAQPSLSKYVKSILGDELPDQHEKFLRNFMRKKDALQNDLRARPKSEATSILRELKLFAHWCEDILTQ